MKERDEPAADRKPYIAVVDDNAVDRSLLITEIENRYGGAYRVLEGTSPADLLQKLTTIEDGRDGVAIVLAAQWMPEVNGTQLLAGIRSRHPLAKRVLLISAADWGDELTADAIRDAIASGCVDNYLPKPIKAADESFHRAISGFLYEWTSSEEGSAYLVTVREEPDAGRPARTEGTSCFDVAIIGGGPAGLAGTTLTREQALGLAEPE